MKALSLLSCVLGAAALAACQQESLRTDPENEVIIAVPGDPVSLDPANTMSGYDGAFLDLVYQQLTAVDDSSDDGRITGELAQRWEVSDDGLSWTFYLREDQAFSDGSPVTADAVKFSFDRVRAVGRAASQGLYWLDEVIAEDALTVRLDLSVPFTAAPAFLALPAFSVVNPVQVTANAVEGDQGMAWLGQNTAGSGLYQLTGWQRGQRLVLEVNPHADTAPAQFSRVVFAMIPNEGSRRLQLEKGDIDYVGGLGAASSRNYEAIEGVELAIADTTMDLRFLTMNTRSPALQDSRVRQAIAAAIDYTALRENVLAGRVGSIAGYLPEGVPGANQNLVAPERDLDRARALLAEAGYDPETELTMTVGAYGPVAEFIQSQLAEAGMTVVLQRLAPSAIEATRATGGFDLFYDGWILDVPDPAIFFNLAFSSRYAGTGVNASGFSTPELDAALDAALSEPDPEMRAAAYRDIELSLIEERPVAMLFGTLPIAAYRSDLQGVRPNCYQTTYMNIADWTRR
jgi:peptide/nickel transport system substrate-binding protein